MWRPKGNQCRKVSRRALPINSIKTPLQGGKKKIDRITWSLQGRMEHGQITFNPDKDWKAFKNQMLDFPNKMAHDDLLDSLAYIDQVSVADFAHSIELEEEWSPVDDIAGY